MDKVKKIIEKYQLEPHSEGGYFKEVYRSDQILQSSIHQEKRNSVTHIYFLLTKDQVSCFHKVLHDEIWNFYEGSSLKLIEFDKGKINETVLDNDNYVKVVKGGVYQAAESSGEYSLVGCSVAPGFDFKDFSFINSKSKELVDIKNKFPDYFKYI
jgi:predicted cupin superfamily sugar epimerase